MSRKTETATRRDWLACLDLLDADVSDQLTAELNAWEGGETCEMIEFTVSNTKLIDSESSPRPAGERWYAFTAYNSQALYGYGTAAEADRYCDLINDSLVINVYAAEELDDAELISALDSGDQSGFTIQEELDADGCLGLPD